MTHLFLLMVLVNGQVESSDMFFYNVHRCNFFANAIVMGKVEKTINAAPRRITLAAYCLPRVADPERVRVY
jgi:hypothetical protein